MRGKIDLRDKSRCRRMTTNGSTMFVYLVSIAACWAFFGFLTPTVSADDLKTLDMGGISIDLRLIDRDRLELHADSFELIDGRLFSKNVKNQDPFDYSPILTDVVFSTSFTWSTMRCVEDLDQCDTSLLRRVPDKTIPRYLYIDRRLDASEALERIHDATITTLIELGFEIKPVRYPRDANTIIIYGTEDYLRASMENLGDDEALARLNQHYSNSNDDAANEFCYVSEPNTAPERSMLYVSNDLTNRCLERALMTTIGLRSFGANLPSISNREMAYDYVTFADRVLIAILYRDDFVTSFTNGDRRMVLEMAVREEYLNVLED